jgi:hypothetical protein
MLYKFLYSKASNSLTMPTLLDEPLRALLDEPDADRASLPVQALAVRAARLAYEIGVHLPESAVVRALAAPNNATLLDALATLLLADATVAPLQGTDVSASIEGREDERRAIFRARFQGHLQLRRLLDDTGGLLRADEAQELLGVSRTALQQWREGRRILALPVGGTFAYPAAQLVPAGTDLEPPRPVAGLTEVLQAAGDALHPAELFAFLATPQAAFGTSAPQDPQHPRPWRSGFDALRGGDAAIVVRAVRAWSVPSDDGAPAPGAGAAPSRGASPG